MDDEKNDTETCVDEGEKSVDEDAPNENILSELWSEQITTADIYRNIMRVEKERRVVYVAVLQPDFGEGGPAKLLGVYNHRFRAEARCYRELKSLGYNQPTDVVEFTLDEDYDLEELDNPS